MNAIATLISLPVFMVLAFLVGPYMAATYPFPLTTRICMGIALISIPAFLAFGIINRRSWAGKITIAVGMLVWLVVGGLGLGTGT